MTKMKFSLAVLAAVGLVGAAAPASADAYYASGVNVDGSNGDFSYEVDVNGTPVTPALYYAGAITYTMNPGTSYNPAASRNYTAWCDDFFNDVYVGNYGNNGYQYYTENADSYLAGVSAGNVHEMAGLAFYGDQHLGNATLDTQIQVAIWELEYNSLPNKITDPNAVNQAAETALIASASGYYNSLVSAGASYAEIVDPTTPLTKGCAADELTYTSTCQIQGQLVIVNEDGTPVPVPEPGTLGLLGSALLALGGFGALRRRKSRTTA